MNRYLRILLFLMGVGSFVMLLVLFLLPTTWTVVRRRDVAAPAARIYPHLEDLQAWKAWSPWQENAYPGLVFHYAGPQRGPGAELDWNSDATGDGVLRIESSAPPHELGFSMAFQHGRIQAHDTIRLEPLASGGTRVVWTDRGSLGRTLLGRLSLGLVEQSMARDLERGLAALAAVATGTASPAAAAPAAPR